MARADAVATLFVGKGRSGKSYQQVYEMVSTWLPDEKGPIWTNLPIDCQKVAEYVAKRSKRPVQEYLDRLHVIDAEVLEAWRDSARNAEHTQDDEDWCGPWDYFSAESGNVIVGGRIILDEAHHYWPFGGCVKFQKKWQVWVGELGHADCQLRLLTQDVEKLSECAVKEAAMKYEVVNSETERDPAFGVLLKDWYELWASVTGIWLAACWVREVRRVFGKNEATHWEKYRFYSSIFELYESHAKPIAGGQSATGEYRREYQNRSPWGVWLWFLKRNAVAVIFHRNTLRAGLVLFFVFGGLGYIFQTTMGITKNAMQMPASDVKKKTAAAAVAGPPRVLHMSKGPSPNLIPDQGFQEAWINDKRMAASTPERVAELDRELSQLRKEIAAGSEVMALQPHRAVLRDGSTVAVGEMMPSGPFAGVHVREIRYPRREVVLADNRVLRVGWTTTKLSTAPVEGQFAPDRTGVPESVPRTLGQRPGDETIGERRRESDGRGGWYEPKRVREIPGKGLPDQRGDGGSVGREADYSRRPRSAAPDDSLNGGTPGRSVGVPDGDGLLPGRSQTGR